MPYRETLERNWAALSDGNIDLILSSWSDDAGVRYDNPSVGAAAVGPVAVRERITLLSQALIERGERLAISRVTEGDRHAIVEWRIEPATDDLRGVHVVEFDPTGKIHAMSVFLSYEP